MCEDEELKSLDQLGLESKFRECHSFYTIEKG